MAIDGKILVKVSFAEKNPQNTLVIVSSSDPLVPVEQWNVVAKVPGDTEQVPLTVTPGINYFSGYVENFWGKSDFSVAVSTPPIPSTTGVILSLSKA